MTADDSTPNRRTIAVLYAIFFVSGFCGLIYESIWSHYLKLLLGHAAYAQAVVLIVFVGGLALGAWLTGRWSERLANPIVLYAAAEILVAIVAFSFHNVYTQVSAWAVRDFLPAFCSAQGPCAATWLLAVALILPPSILLGTTFPLMSAGVLRLGANPGRGLSLLYFLNSAGAAFGVLCSGFLLIPMLGLPGTMLFAGSLNAMVGLASYMAARGYDLPAIQTAQAPAGPTTASALGPLLAIALLTGFSSFIYEVVWIRMLTLVLGAATHSFELMLSTFIMGLALGAWWIRNRIDTSPRPQALLANVQIIMGVMAIATIPLYAGSFEAMAYSLRGLSRSDEAYLFFNVASGFLATVVMMPAAFCAGMTLPLITALLLRSGRGERQIGQVYGINTLGAILGVLVAVHLLMPLTGLKWSLAVAALVDILLGLYLYWRLRQQGPVPESPDTTGRWLAVVGAASVALVIAIPLASDLSARKLASGVFRTGNPDTDSGYNVIYQRDGKTATVTVLEGKRGDRSLLTNGKSDGSTHPQRKISTPDDQTVVMLGALGPMHHPGAKRAAVIGLGTGVTSSVLLEAKGLERVDTIEIEPLMADAAQLFRPRSEAVFTDPRSNIVIDDARAHFARTPARYDIIVSEPSNPWVSGVSGLFTHEFYRHVSNHLAPDGHFVQWLHLYEASPEMVGAIVQAFGSVFPQFRAYATNSADIVLVARNDKRMPAVSPGTLERLPGVRDRLADIGIASEAMLAAHETAPADVLRVVLVAANLQPNSDYYPFVDHRASKDRFQKQSATGLFDLHSAPIPLQDLLAGAPLYGGKADSAAQHMPGKVHDYVRGFHGHRYLRGETLSAQEMAKLAEVNADYYLVRGWLADCRLPRDDDAIWDAALRVSTDLNRSLDADTARRFWKDAGTRCARSLSPVKAAWLELFGAAGARDAAALRGAADKVLALDQHLTVAGREYAMAGAVASRLVLNEGPAAREVFLAQGKFISSDRINQLWMRYIAAVVRKLDATGPAGAPVTPKTGAPAKG